MAAAHQRRRSLPFTREPNRRGQLHLRGRRPSAPNQHRYRRDARRTTPALVAYDVMELAARVEQRFRRALRATPVDDLDVARMLILLGRRREALRPSDIAELLSVSRSTATRIVDRADAAGFVDRVRPILDRRSLWCQLTAGGELARQEVERALDLPVRNLLGADLQTMAGPLTRVAASWRKRASGSGIRWARDHRLSA
jgi:DNA-binding MarR family transcriptional regulator